jgi:glucosamine-6-phosphate deaminase
MNATRLTIARLNVVTHPDRVAMGAAAADQAAHEILEVITKEGAARIILACAPSQDEFLTSLTSAPGIDWSRVTIFHIDEYVGLPEHHPATFRSFHRKHLLAKIIPAAFHGIRGESTDPDAECRRYAALLAEAPIDLICMGIGENGHIAFNDPPAADFQDPLPVKVVELDETSRQQQVHDGFFPDMDSVPKKAITLTCPTLLAAKRLVCIVPGPRKAAAVSNTLRAATISPLIPATILRMHPRGTLHLDAQSAKFLTGFR